jgi:hypothetical protein
MTFPSDMPVLLFNKEELKVNEDGKTYVNFYQTQKFKKVTLKGNHYLHWTRSKEMSEHINDFTEK